MKAVAIRFLVAATLAFALSGVLAADTIKLAFLGGLSGPYALQDEEILKNVRAAADLVNARIGVAGGHLFEIVPLDHKANPQDALIVLKQAIDQDIRFVISGRSNIAHAIIDALNKHNARDPERSVLFLNLTGIDPVLTESKCSFWHFRFAVHSDTMVGALADYMAARPSVKTVYLLNQDYAYGQAVARAAREMLPRRRADIRIVGDDLVPLGKIKDFAPYVAKIRASGADSVMTGNWGSDLTLLVKASAEAGLKASYYTLAAATPGNMAASGTAGVDRVTTLATWSINVADPVWEKTLLGYKTRYQALSNLDSLIAFRVMEMLAMAIGTANSVDPVKVAFALEGMRYAGPSGTSWMRAEDHQIIAPIYVLRFVKAGQQGVKHDEEGSGYGWKMEALIPAKDAVPPLNCLMVRPPM
jgi:branched-chain amino acid transport system substrate-binding protein